MSLRDMRAECTGRPPASVPIDPWTAGRLGYRPAVLRVLGAVLAATTVGGLLAVSGCSGGGLSTGGCASPHRDLLDVRSTLHLLPGAPEPPYSTDPPTSGAHRVGYYPRGVVATPIARATQVALLEKGFVVVQYRSSLGTAAENALAPLTALSPYVALAPNPALPNPVVATSWLHDLRCGGVGANAVTTLSLFVTQRIGQGAEPTIPLQATSPGGVTTTTLATP
jgi:hypothetical protein